MIAHDDQTFRLALLVIVMLTFPIAAFHRLRSHATREALDRRQEGLFILLTLRPLGLAMWVVSGVALTCHCAGYTFRPR